MILVFNMKRLPSWELVHIVPSEKEHHVQIIVFGQGYVCSEGIIYTTLFKQYIAVEMYFLLQKTIIFLSIAKLLC